MYYNIFVRVEKFKHIYFRLSPLVQSQILYNEMVIVILCMKLSSRVQG